jgi:NADPH-dependent 2,4-dienoyl-CoA reductase/sulfur reductase-like enzyme
MKKTDVLVIGGSAAGLVAAMTAKSNNADKTVTLIRKEDTVMIPCGIPYIFGTVESSDKNILPDGGLVNLGVEIVVDEVTSIDKDSKTCASSSGETYAYDKLIIATGSLPSQPGWLKGTDLQNVFTIPKNKVYLDDLQHKLTGCKKIVTVGAGFIGIEISDELNKIGKEMTLVEILPRVLGVAFDEEFAAEAEARLIARGVSIKTGVGIKEIIGTARVEGVLLDNGEKLEADAVILSLGYRPNTALAKDAGLEINKFGFIKVDQYRRTGEKDIFAAGDCSEKRDFATGKLSTIMLASTACAEARVAAMNLYRLSTVSTFRGTIGIYSTNIGETSLGVAGLTEALARKEGFDVVAASFTGIDRHPGCLGGAHKQTVKLIASRDSGVILGGEAMGGASVGELTNVLGFIIQSSMTINDLLVAQIGTQPMLTASPAGYPLIKAAEAVARQLRA